MLGNSIQSVTQKLKSSILLCHHNHSCLKTSHVPDENFASNQLQPPLQPAAVLSARPVKLLEAPDGELLILIVQGPVQA